MYTTDVVDQINDYESGTMSDEDQITFFQHLVDSGLAWNLQGSYARTADGMLRMGLIQARQ